VDFELIKPEAQDAYDPAPFLSYARARQADRAERDADVGDVVHFWSPEHPTCRAAIVMETASLTDEATLRVHIPHEPYQDRTVKHSEDRSWEAHGDASWHWPCGGH
jgi:hypothetical protein